MKRRLLQVLALCVAALLALRVIAQDTGAGTMDSGNAAGGSTGADNSGASGGTGAAGSNGNSNGGTSQPATGAGDQGGTGTGTTPAGSSLFGPGTGTEALPSTSTPGPVPAAPEQPAPAPAAAPAPTPPQSISPTAGTGGAQAAPVTLSLPGGFGGSPSKSFTLGEGRLAERPITFTLSVTQGYDDNIFSATAHPVPAPTPLPAPTPPLQYRLLTFRISPPNLPTPVYVAFRPQALPTPSVPTSQPLGIIGSAVSTATLGVHVQKGTPRTVITADASVAEQIYWQQPGGKEDYTGGFTMSLVQRLTPRATFTIDSNTTYQKTPNFALINAPTNAGNNGSYLNGSTTATLNYAWTKRVATVATYVLITNLLETNGQSNLYDNSYGVQFRYTASARNTITADAREEVAIYPSNTGANGNTTYLLMGLDSTISTRLRNTFSTGIESQSYSSGGGGGTPDAPYFESATTLSLPRGAGLSWTNRYGYQEAGGVGQTTTSYRTGLSYSQPLSTKLVASVSLAYNHLKNTDTLDPTAAYTETQLQASLNLGYTVTPRLSLSLSYTYNDLLTTQLNGSYQRDQVYLGGTYTFR